MGTVPARNLTMLYMVIERTPAESVAAVGRRFKKKGRMLPEGVEYQASWLNEDGSVCYQLMESPTREGLELWISRWSDLVRFEVVPVRTSADFWAIRGEGGGEVPSASLE
jgi:Protein of unknown function (DUF3303).